jgi:hypothetical protein
MGAYLRVDPSSTSQVLLVLFLQFMQRKENLILIILKIQLVLSIPLLDCRSSWLPQSRKPHPVLQTLMEGTEDSVKGGFGRILLNQHQRQQQQQPTGSIDDGFD